MALISSSPTNTKILRSCDLLIGEKSSRLRAAPICWWVGKLLDFASVNEETFGRPSAVFRQMVSHDVEVGVQRQCTRCMEKVDTSFVEFEDTEMKLIKQHLSVVEAKGEDGLQIRAATFIFIGGSRGEHFEK